MITEWDVKVKFDGKDETISVPESETLLDALINAGIDAPYSCRTGLCTECAARVTEGLDNVALQPSVTEEKTTAKGFVLTCASNVTGPGVVLELDQGDAMYDSQYGNFRDDHQAMQTEGAQKKGFGGLVAGLKSAAGINVEA